MGPKTTKTDQKATKNEQKTAKTATRNEEELNITTMQSGDIDWRSGGASGAVKEITQQQSRATKTEH